MAKKKVCCSFDYEHDRNYYNLLEAWNKNDNIDFSIKDCTPSEIQSESISVIKQVLSTKSKLYDCYAFEYRKRESIERTLSDTVYVTVI